MKFSIEFKYRFEVLIPLRDNQGKPFSPSTVYQVGTTLLNRFGGCRAQLLSPYLGLWQEREVVYREEFILWVVDAPWEDESLRWFSSYKRRLKRQFKQLEIYLAVSEVLWL